MIDRRQCRLSIVRQCALLGLARSSFYYRKRKQSADNDEVMRLIDEQYTKTPFYGIRRMTEALRRMGRCINHKRVAQLMRLMGLQAIYPKPRLSSANKEHRKYPYLLRKLSIVRPDQVWSTDITYIRLRHGFVYLAAIMDWFSRYVISWSLSITLDADFCVDMLKDALMTAQPEIFNSDQGVQFTSEAFTGVLEDRGVKISMDGRGRAFDNIFVERLWRSVKYEEVYLKDYSGVRDATDSLRRYFDFYNNERPHQSLDYRTPSEVYFAGTEKIIHTELMGGIQLISRSVLNTKALLSQEALQGAPAGQSQEIYTLKDRRFCLDNGVHFSYYHVDRHVLSTQLQHAIEHTERNVST
jgi:putative transposase